MSQVNGYELSRDWFDFAFENPEKIRPIHSAVYFFAIEHCNRLGWKQKFKLPSSMVMEAIGVKSHNTYIKAFRNLVEWGFFDLIQESKNQYSSNIIALSKNCKAPNKALDKALIKHTSKQVEGTGVGTDSVYKQGTREQRNNKPEPVPSLKEVKNYFTEKGFPIPLAEKFYSYYQEPMKDRGGRAWKDQNGKTVKSWKQKALAVWMKDDRKEEPKPQYLTNDLSKTA